VLTCDGFEKAIIGYGTHFSSDVIIYSYDECVNILMKRDKMTHEEALEWMEYNVCGAWLGANTPVFLRNKHLGDDNYD
jgi:hypothetical protein